MGYQLRIEYAGALYHVMAHGNGFQWIYKNSSNLNAFCEILIKVIIKYKFKVHAFILMRNHYHLLIETPLPNLSKGMQTFNRELAILLNLNYKRKGSIFKKRYKSILIEKEKYYLNVLRYILQNALRLNLVNNAEEYMGSSLWHLLSGKNRINIYMYYDTIRNYFPGRKWKSKFVKWVNDEMEEDIQKNMKYKFLIGSKSWVTKIKNKYIKKEKISEFVVDKKIIRSKEFGFKEVKNIIKKIKEIKKEMINIDDVIIYIMSKYTSFTQSEIGNYLRIVKSNTVGQRLKRFKKKITEIKRIGKLIKLIESKL